MTGYTRKQEECNFQPGDRVKVLRTAESFDNGWENTWEKEMDDQVGKILTIEWVDKINGVSLSDGFSYPYFVLEKVEEDAPIAQAGIGG